MLLSTPPWNLAPDLPWRVFTNPAEVWAERPSFVVGELLFITCAVLALVHALRQGETARVRAHLTVWFGALIAGTVNDLLFMALPLVDNFWQAQASIMITPRLPLYIPCVYVCFMYFPTVAAWRIGLAPVAQAALTGILGLLFYWPYDIVGAKFLWWTWHDTDMPIARRLLGVPIGSSMWILTFVAAFSWLISRPLLRDPAVSRATIAKAIGLSAGLSTLFMMVQMTALQQIDGGTPGPWGLAVTVSLWALLAAMGLRSRLAAPRAEARAGDAPSRQVLRIDRVLAVTAATYFATLLVIMAVFDPTTHRSESLHQTYGACHVEAKDITGNTRYQFICAEDFDEDFTFCGGALPAAGSDWYTVCGRPHSSRTAWLVGVATLGILGSLLYGLLLARRWPALERR